jgi:hypothetical protein
MFLDSCPAHPKSAQKKLKNIRLEYFPPNMTSVLQPMDLGIIKNLKHHYRKTLVKKRLQDLENNNSSSFSSITLLDAINMIAEAWQNDVKETTIKNCFDKAGFSVALHQTDQRFEITEIEDEDEDESFDQFSSTGFSSLNEYVSFDDDLANCAMMTDDDIIESINEIEMEIVDEDSNISEDVSNLDLFKYNLEDIKQSIQVLQNIILTTDGITIEMFDNFYKMKRILLPNAP